jgi:ABC-2 type transport system permease protein
MKLDRLKILNSFKDKKFKYGGYATLLTAFVLAILIIVNLVVGQIPFKIDLTENRLFSLSDQTDTILKNLDQEIQIIGLYKTGSEDKVFDEILQVIRRVKTNTETAAKYLPSTIPVKEVGLVNNSWSVLCLLSSGISLMVRMGTTIKKIKVMLPSTAL